MELRESKYDYIYEVELFNTGFLLEAQDASSVQQHNALSSGWLSKIPAILIRAELRRNRRDSTASMDAGSDDEDCRADGSCNLFAGSFFPSGIRTVSQESS